MIRAARPGDRDALAGVLHGDASFRDDERRVALQLIDGALAGDPDYLVRVAITPDDAVAGYVCYGPTAMTRATYDLYWLVVAPAARGRGLGRALVTGVEAELRGRGGGNIRIETSPAPVHAAARALYARLGYPIACELPAFYRPDGPDGPGENLLIYYKQIPAG
jgi:ribosomal protein S18 acetylase RimI-like enzyme